MNFSLLVYDPAIGHFCHYSVKGISQNPPGPSASGKIPEAFEASVVTAQQVMNPVRATSLDVGSFAHGHVAHANHAYRDHPGPNLVIFFLFVRLFKFFQFSAVHISLKEDLIYKLFGWLGCLLKNFCASL